MDLKNVSPKLIEKAKGLSQNELLELAKSKGIELSDEQLEGIAGGEADWTEGKTTVTCEDCGAQFTYDMNLATQRCPSCNALYINEMGR